jgi:replicative DNA helicase
MVKGGLTFIKAPRGTGKTEVIRYFETGLLKNGEDAVAMLHMEEMKSTTYRAMATYELGVNVRTKEDAEQNNVSESNVIEAAKIATKGEKSIIFEMMSHDDPLKVLDYVRLSATVYGAGYVFIDHVQRLAYLSNSGVDGATSTLTTLGSRMAQLAKELNIGVVFISQVNDDGRTKYAASLEEEAIICIKLERTAESEDEVEQNTTNFIVDKNRPFAKLGRAGSVYYDPVTTILREDLFTNEAEVA